MQVTSQRQSQSFGARVASGDLRSFAARIELAAEEQREARTLFWEPYSRVSDRCLAQRSPHKFQIADRGFA